jgi:small subunit ribosomal protein S5
MQSRQPRQRTESQDLTLQDKVVFINRVAKVVKGGRRFSFTAMVVVGDGQGHVGAALGKAREVPEAIRKATAKAKKHLMPVTLKGHTIHYQVMTTFGAARVLLKPAKPGTGVIAGGGVRAVVELVGIRDIVTKSLGSSNAANVVHCTMKALRLLQDPVLLAARRKARSPAPAEAMTKPPAGTPIKPETLVKKDGP